MTWQRAARVGAGLMRAASAGLASNRTEHSARQNAKRKARLTAPPAPLPARTQTDAAFLTEESCTQYNVLKMARWLFQHTGDAGGWVQRSAARLATMRIGHCCAPLSSINHRPTIPILPHKPQSPAALADFHERAMLNGVIGVQKLRRQSHASHSQPHGHPHGHSHAHLLPPPGAAHTAAGEDVPGDASGGAAAAPRSQARSHGSSGGGGGAQVSATRRNDSHPHYTYAPRHSTHIHLHNSHFHNVRRLLWFMPCCHACNMEPATARVCLAPCAGSRAAPRAAPSRSRTCRASAWLCVLPAHCQPHPAVWWQGSVTVHIHVHGGMDEGEPSGEGGSGPALHGEQRRRLLAEAATAAAAAAEAGGHGLARPDNYKARLGLQLAPAICAPLWLGQASLPCLPCCHPAVPSQLAAPRLACTTLPPAAPCRLRPQTLIRLP